MGGAAPVVRGVLGGAAGGPGGGRRRAGPGGGLRSRLQLPALSGLLLALAFPPLHLWFPTFLALVPLALWVEGVGVRGWRLEWGPPPAESRALHGGAMAGAVSWALLLHWMPLSLGRFSAWAWAGWAVAVALLSLHAAGVVWLLHRLRHRGGAPLWLALPLAWTAGEVVRAELPGSLAFPWLELATSLAGTPQLLGLAELVGSRGVGFWLVLSQGLLAWTLVRTWPRSSPADAGAAPVAGAGSRTAHGGVGGAADRRGLFRGALATTLVLLVPAAWSVHRVGQLEIRPVVRVAVVQPSVSQALKLRDPSSAAERGLATAERWVERSFASVESEEDVDVVILPEAVVPLRLSDGSSEPFRRRVEALADRVDAPVLLGSLSSDGGIPFNSVFLVLPGRGLQEERYDKRHLVPVVERIPLGPFLDRIGGRAGPAAPGGGGAEGLDRYGSLGFGRGPEVLGDPGLGPLVCWESAFSRAARSRRRAGARVLVNVTNDAWFNGPTVWHRSVALWQHPAHLVLRAVETRTGVVRAANTGLSLVVDPAGRTEVLAPPWQEAVAVRTVGTTAGATLWVRIGDIPARSAAIVALLFVAVSLLPSRSGRALGARVEPTVGPGERHGADSGDPRSSQRHNRTGRG